MFQSQNWGSKRLLTERRVKREEYIDITESGQIFLYLNKQKLREYYNLLSISIVKKSIKLIKSQHFEFIMVKISGHLTENKNQRPFDGEKYNNCKVNWIFSFWVQLPWYHGDIIYKCIASHFTYLEITSTFISISVFEFLNQKIFIFMFENFPALLRHTIVK